MITPSATSYLSLHSHVLTQLVDEDDEVLMALLNLEGNKPGKICASFEDLERQRREEEQKKAEEEAKKRLEEEKRLFAEARKSMVSLRDQKLVSYTHACILLCHEHATMW